MLFIIRKPSILSKERTMKRLIFIPFILLSMSTVVDVFGQQMKPKNPGDRTEVKSRLDVDGLTLLGSGTQGIGHRMDVEMAGNRAYVLRGIEGLETWDISNPANPIRLDQKPPAAWGAKSYGNRLYVFNRNSGFRIYDISGSTPAYLGNFNPVDPDALFENGVLGGTVLYVAAHQLGLYFFDVSNASAPTYQDHVVLADNACWDVEKKGSFLFVANGHHGLSVVELTTTPSEVAVLPLPGLANHIELDGDVAFLTLGCDGVATVDISVPAAPQLLDIAPSGGNAFGCGLLDHKVAVGSWTMIELFDISDPMNIRRIGWDNTATWAQGADIAPYGNESLVGVADWTDFSTYLVGDDPDPDINVHPDRLDFGVVTQAEEKTVHVKNTGRSMLNVNISTPPTGISVDPTSFSVPPGEVKKVKVTASGAGSTFSTLSYSSNDPDESSVIQYVYKNNTSFPQIDDLAPDFTVQDIDGNWHTLSDYVGKVVYLEFGGLW
jgi:hypothetical protein